MAKPRGTKVELISCVKISTGLVKGCQSRKGNAGQWWQWCVTTELTNSGIGISEVRSLPGLDFTQDQTGIGRVASDFSGRTCLPWKKQPARGGKCNEPAHRWWAGKMLLVGMISKSAPPSVLSFQSLNTYHLIPHISNFSLLFFLGLIWVRCHLFFLTFRLPFWRRDTIWQFIWWQFPQFYIELGIFRF